MDTRIGYVDGKQRFVCRDCVQNEDEYENLQNTVVLSTDDWKDEVGFCSCGNSPRDIEPA